MINFQCTVFLQKYKIRFYKKHKRDKILSNKESKPSGIIKVATFLITNLLYPSFNSLILLIPWKFSIVNTTENSFLGTIFEF